MLTKLALMALVIVLGVSLVTSRQQINEYKNNVAATEKALKETERQQGFACGLLTKKQAEGYLQRSDLQVGGTVIARNSTVTAVVGGPRVDSCSYTSAGSSLNYIDIVTKTYDSQANAVAYFDEGLQKILYLEDRSSDKADTLFYSSGVYYALINNAVLEVSAARSKMSAGSTPESFTKEILDYVITKL